MEDYRAGHRKRLKEKYIENRANLVFDYEVLELLLTYAIPRRDVKPAAKALLRRFGSLDRVLAADEKQLCAVEGIGQNAAVLITLIRELEGRAEKSRNNDIKALSNAQTALSYFENMLRHSGRERCIIACLDNSNRIIAVHEAASGDVNHVDINSREVAQIVLLDNASRVIVAHNHPFGGAEPSAGDIDLTLSLRSLLASVNISLIDHIIVGESSSVSMRSCAKYSHYFSRSGGVSYEQ